MFCRHCGAQNETDALFCVACGSPMGETAPAQPEMQQPVYQQPVYQDPNQPVYQQPIYQQPVYVYQQPMYQKPPKPPMHGMAIAAMILGILSLISYSIAFGVLGIVFGGIAKGKGNKGGMAMAGIVTGIIGCVISVIYLALSYVEIAGMM